jgi:hypothetical protein
MNSFDSKGEKMGAASGRERKTKKPYSKPVFRFERVFETSAMACGKTATQANCAHAVKSS